MVYIQIYVTSWNILTYVKYSAVCEISSSTLKWPEFEVHKIL